MLDHPPEQSVRDHQVFVAWFTGLPSAGKSTLATIVSLGLEKRGVSTEILDGDHFRNDRSPALGYSKSDRDRNVKRLARAAATLAQSGASVLVAAIAPYEQTRRRAREIVEVHARFVEVYVDAPIDVCIRRDPKGHYQKALTGELAHFTGVSDPYEPPASPDLTVDTEMFDPDQSAAHVLATFEALGLAPAPYPPAKPIVPRQADVSPRDRRMA